VRKERALRPDAAWRDAAVDWNVDGSLTIDFQREGAGQRERMQLATTDPRWRPER
jgi:hypothetical protein